MDIYELPEVASQFIAWCKSQKKSYNTLRSYSCDLRQLFNFLIKHKNYQYNSVTEFTLDDIKQISIYDLDSFIEALDSMEKSTKKKKRRKKEEVNNERSASTKCRKMNTMRSFYDYLCRGDLLEKNITLKLELPEIQTRKPKYLSEKQASKLLDVIHEENKYIELRNFAIIALLLSTGVRRFEVANLTINDLNDDEIRIIGKRNKERFIPLNDLATSALNNYLKVRKGNDKSLFLSDDGKQISIGYVGTIVKKYLKAAGLDEYSTHKLRHTAATLIYKNNPNLLALQDILGHKSSKTTEIYTHIDTEQKKKAVNSNPLNNYKRTSK
jgi:integrase/recombinase XerD